MRARSARSRATPSVRPRPATDFGCASLKFAILSPIGFSRCRPTRFCTLVAQRYARVQTADVDPNFVKMWFECTAMLKFFVRATSFLPLALPGGYVDWGVVDATATTA